MGLVFETITIYITKPESGDRESGRDCQNPRLVYKRGSDGRNDTPTLHVWELRSKYTITFYFCSFEADIYIIYTLSVIMILNLFS